MQNRISKTVEWLSPWLTMQQHSQHDTHLAPLAVIPSPPLNIRLTLLTFTFYLFGVYLGVSAPQIYH